MYKLFENTDTFTPKQRLACLPTNPHPADKSLAAVRPPQTFLTWSQSYFIIKFFNKEIPAVPSTFNM